ERIIGIANRADDLVILLQFETGTADRRTVLVLQCDDQATESGLRLLGRRGLLGRYFRHGRDGCFGGLLARNLLDAAFVRLGRGRFFRRRCRRLLGRGGGWFLGRSLRRLGLGLCLDDDGVFIVRRDIDRLILDRLSTIRHGRFVQCVSTGGH